VHLETDLGWLFWLWFGWGSWLDWHIYNNSVGDDAGVVTASMSISAV